MASFDEIFGYLTNKTQKQISPAPIKETTIVQAPNSERAKVLLIYGHDDRARDSAELLCRRLNFEPFILSIVGVNSDTIYSQIIAAVKASDFVLALLTHDDFAYTGSDPDKCISPRARQNVILELGMAIGCIELQRIMIIFKNGVELPSDLAGVVRFQYSDKVSECYIDVAQVFQRFGHDVDLNALKS